MDDIRQLFSTQSWHAFTQRLFPCQCKICKQTSSDLVCNQCQNKMHLPEDVCYRCGESLADRRVHAQDSINICGHCISHPPTYTKTIFAYAYQGHAATLIQQFKFREDLMLCQFLAASVCDQILAQNPDQQLPGVLIPIPLHTQRLKQRGFNQAYELAKQIGKQLHIPVYKDYLRRTRPTPQQSGLTRKARQRNIQGAFSLKHLDTKEIAVLIDKHIAIVDDVITTGSTVREAAKILNRAHPCKISIFAIAKTQQDAYIG